MSHTLIIAEAGVNHNGKLDLALQLCDAAKEVGADFMEQLRTLPHVKDVRGQGLLVGVEFDDSISGVEVKHGCLDRKLLITAIGAHVIRMVPPLIVSAEECDKAYLSDEYKEFQQIIINFIKIS